MSKKVENAQQEPAMPARLEVHYRENVLPKLMERFKYKNVMMVPRLEKISVNIGVGEAASEPKLLETAMQELGQITGQKPQVRK
ncbi:MAG: 50S ribosomal protein L5, partial [Chlorobiales bacterium]|nr:50S ribosomal protein L5 [Chlorobiales bacterium]